MTSEPMPSAPRPGDPQWIVPVAPGRYRYNGTEVGWPHHLTLAEIAGILRQEDPQLETTLGFRNPHSYRGDYTPVAFEPAQNITLGEMLTAVESAIGATYQGWKGGTYTMDADTPAWLADEGHGDGETIGALLMTLIISSAA